jgi:adenylylsulfate kinase-like enzyme
MVIWLIGLSGAGKTTIGRHVHRQWQSEQPNTVLVDGDEMRSIFEQDRGPDDYTVEGRRRNAHRISRICGWLDSQGINVVCCILSIFPESLEWNREHYTSYFEVFVDAPLSVVTARDSKGLYGAARRGEERNVVGIDIEFPPPAAPDMIIDNSVEGASPEEFATEILERAGVTRKDGQ